MQRLLAMAVLSALIFSSVSSYAWVCSYRGPLGHVYSSGGGGYGRDAAKGNALAACGRNKAQGYGPCKFMGCRR